MKTTTRTKRLGATLLLILTCMLPSFAVDYGITVGGVKVTSDNMNNIKGSSITSGSVTYNPSSKRLTLSNVEITYTSGYGISSSVQGLEIYFTGTSNYIKATFPLNIDATATVRGSSASVNLQLDATISPIWVNRDVNLTIKDISMTTSGSTSSGAIRGYGSNSTLTLSNANIAISAGEYPCVKGITDCTMEGTDVASPSGACYRKILKGFGTKTALTTGTLKFFRVKESYPVSLCGHQLNDVNTHNFCYDNVEGSVTYRKVTQMISQGVYSVRQALYLQDVTGSYDAQDDYCIKVTDECALTINCQGTNTFTSNHHAGLYTNSTSAEVWGGGTLDLNGSIILDSSTGKCDFLVGDGSTLNASFIRGAGSGTFSVNDSQVNLSGNNDETAISGFDDLSLYKVDFVEPEGGTYSQYVLDGSGNKWSGAVRIGEKSYGITVGGVAVTTKNMSNITGSNISGSVSFGRVGDMNTLVLDDVTINNGQGYGVGNRSGKPLKIMVSGTCSLTGTHAIYSEDDLTIQGGLLENSRLILNGNYTGICMSNYKTLSIGYINVTASGATNYGCIRGGGHSRLVMIYSNIGIDAGSYPCVKGFDACVHGLMEVTYPGEVCYRSRLTGFGNDKGLTTGDLILKRVSEEYGIEVAGHKLNNLNKDNFYYENVSGIVEYNPDKSVLTLAEFTADCEGFRRGINITSDKDVTIYFEADNKFYNTYNNIGISADMEGKGLYIFGYGSLEMDGGVDINGDLIMTAAEEGDEHTVKAKYIRGSEDSDFLVGNFRIYLDGDGTNSTIRGFNRIKGENFAFARPIDATYSDGELWSDGQVYTGRVIIGYVDHDTAIGEALQEHDVTVDATYDVMGRRTGSSRSGIILQHMSDGTVRKQLVK